MTCRSPTLRTIRAIAACLFGASCLPGMAAEVFAPAGTRAVLSVEYAYTSAGRKSSQGMYDPYEWRVKRNLSMEAQLAAQPPTPMPTVQAPDAASTAKLQDQATRMQAATAQMAPMVADVEKIMARCGENEECISRAVQGMGDGMARDPQRMGAMNAARKDAQALGPGAMRYQAWRPTAQKGTYVIEESVQVSVTDPICAHKPRRRCTREETRKGSGEVPVPAPTRPRPNPGAAAGMSAVELDVEKGVLAITLPAPLAMLAFTETITSDEPDGTHDTPIPRGTRRREAFFRVSASGSGFMHEKPIAVPLKGGMKDQQGEYSVPLKGSFGDAGTLVVRWRFKVL